MSSTKLLYIQGLEGHLERLEESRILMLAGREFGGCTEDTITVDGNEDLKMVTQQLGSGLFSVSKWIGGQSLKLFTSALDQAGKSLIKTFGDNEVLIRKITQSLSNDGETEYKVPAEKLNLITSDGDIDSLNSDLDSLIATLTALQTHNREVLNYLDKKLFIARKLKSVTNSAGVFTVAEEFNELSYPPFKLPTHKGDSFISRELPSGKVFEYKSVDGKPTYLISGDKPAGAGTSITLTKSQVSTLLTKLGKVNSLHKDLKGFYEGYLGFLKSWTEMVKAVDGSLAKVKWLSNTATGEVEKILAGESNTLAFYSGFTPRVVGYTDRYIHGVLGVFA